MIIDKKLIHKAILFTAVILFSLLFLFIGNKIATKDLTAFDDVDASEQIKVEVLKVIDSETLEYNLGGEENLTSKTISFTAKVLKGELEGKTITATQTIDTLLGYVKKEVESGDKILAIKTINTETNAYEWVAGEYLRTDTLIILGIIFGLFLLWFGKTKGISTIMSLVFTCSAVFAVFIPATLSGLNIYFWSIITCIFIIIMTLLIVYGANIKSFAAGIGCFGGVVVSALLSISMNKILLLTGMTDDSSLFLSLLTPEKPIDLKAIIFASIIIGALGGVIDVSVSMASSLTEVQHVSGETSFRSLFKSGISIGRDIMGVNLNTLILAYIGSSMSVVLLMIANNHSLLAVMNRERIVVEILQALIGSFGILLTIPLTALVCAAFYGKKGKAMV